MKNTLLLLAIFTASLLSAQVDIKTSNARLKFSQYDLGLSDDQNNDSYYLMLVNGIGTDTELEYKGVSNNIKWTDSNGFSSTQSTFTAEDGLTYKLEVDGALKHTIYVRDYQKFSPKYKTLTIIDGSDACAGINLQLDADIPAITYVDIKGATRTLERKFSIEYADLVWDGESWTDTTQIKDFPSSSNTMYVDAPKGNTMFMFYGDQWAQQMSLPTDTIYSRDYMAVAIEVHPKGIIVEREHLNEKDRTTQGDIRGSGPLVVDFKSNANPIQEIFYEWTYWNVKTPDAYTRYTDSEFRHTFVETGEYQVNLVVNSSYGCEFKDSMTVKVIESFIDVPNAFTPNGDGINDEFRVVYRSIENYVCIVKNRWGRTVFKSDNPGKGWDGKIGGAEAAVGAYYYIIIATGTDEDEDGKPIKYKLSGDINLLR